MLLSPASYNAKAGMTLCCPMTTRGCYVLSFLIGAVMRDGTRTQTVSL
ncbi:MULTISPECIES: hypothetical protein [Komagataeibacter]